ncbi:MAG: 50S ribosomal protein L20 [Parcubacteria group bacterium]|nr:MAG: 50S ribosomal protein L20 [Parcubacteria group bacterium]
MPRVKRGTTHVKHRKNILKKTKGFKWGRKNKIRAAKEAILHAGVNAQRDRHRKKRVHRALWQTKLNAALRPLGSKYSTFIDQLKKNKIALDRKVLAQLAEHNPKVFAAIVKELK